MTDDDYAQYQTENAIQNAIIDTMAKIGGTGHCTRLALMVWAFYPQYNIMEIQSQINTMLEMDWLIEDAWGNIFLGFDE